MNRWMVCGISILVALLSVHYGYGAERETVIRRVRDSVSSYFIKKANVALFPFKAMREHESSRRSGTEYQAQVNICQKFPLKSIIDSEVVYKIENPFQELRALLKNTVTVEGD